MMESKLFARNKQLPPLFQDSLLRGQIQPIEDDKSTPQLAYQHPNGQLWIGDSITWLRTLSDQSVDLIFADPPYNIKKADWDTFDNQQVYVEWSMQWIEEAARVLKPNGTLYICGFSEILADLKAPAMKLFKSSRWLIWHYKNKANLGNDWGRSHESIMHLRKAKNHTFNTDDVRIPYGEHTLKYPTHPQAETSQFGQGRDNSHIWHPHPDGAKPKDVLDIPEDFIEIPTTCNGMHEKTPHKTQKPEELVRKILLASSNDGDTVLDPFLGSGTTAVCAEQLNRNWLGCDLSTEYIGWAIERLELVENWSVEKWKKYDFDNQKRRASIRRQSAN